jgi:hypothetical protein
MKSKIVLTPERNMGTYSLAISDAVAFTSVQSCMSIATALRRDLADRAQVLSAQHTVDIAIALISAAELTWGRGKSSQLVGMIVNVSSLDAFRRATVYKLIREAIGKLPLSLWGDRVTSRKEMIEELEKHTFSAHAELPVFPSKLEKREEEWREAAVALRQSRLAKSPA